MSSKSQVLELLEKYKGTYLSGEEMAKQLELSRNAIWKAINELRKSGYEIDAIKNRGYLLVDSHDIISEQGILSCLYNDKRKTVDDSVSESLYSTPKIIIYDSLESTNRTAKEMAIAGAAHGTIIIADAQTGGKAHDGKSFLSPQGGLYMSVILSPTDLTITEPSHISAFGAVSVCQTFEELTDLSPSIKLVTDIFSGDEKISGILTESAFDLETNKLQWIVIGIGIPNKAKGFRNQFIASIISKLLSADVKDEDIISYYKSHHE